MDDFWHGQKDCVYCGGSGIYDGKTCFKCRGTGKVPNNENIPERRY